jgi:hypothetical protein
VTCGDFCSGAGISGDAAILAQVHIPGDGSISASAKILRFDGAAWVHEATIAVPEGSAWSGVDISGNTALVPDATAGDVTFRVLRFDGSAWTESAELDVTEGTPTRAPSVSGDTVLIGSYEVVDPLTTVGSAEIFTGVSTDSAPVSYVALGDSYSSGEGVKPYEDGTEPGEVDTDSAGNNMCHRSRQAYSRFVQTPMSREWGESVFQAAARGEAGFAWENASCSGAETLDVLSDSLWGEGPQIQQVNADVGLVTVTIGGNDAFFSTVLKECMKYDDCHLRRWPDPGQEMEDWLRGIVNDTVSGNLVRTFCEIRNAAPDAAVFVLGYPHLVAGEDVCAQVSIGLLWKLEIAEQQFLRRMSGLLNQTIADAARKAGVHFVEGVARRFAGHELCGASSPWLFGNERSCASPSDRTHCGHPNSAGQRAYAAELQSFIDVMGGGWVHGYLPSGFPRNPSPSVPDPCSASQPAVSSLSALATTSAALGELLVEAAQPPPCAGLLAFVPGQTLRIRGAGFAAGASVSVMLRADGFSEEVGPIEADSTGNFDAAVALPTSTPAPTLASLDASGEAGAGGSRTLVATLNLAVGFAEDTDQDGVPDACDNCPFVAGTDQTDTDGDGRGDLCDVCPGDAEDDWDGDGLCSNEDPCPLDPQNDADGDGFCADVDNCPNVFNPDQLDADGDGYGDACPVTPECNDGLDNDLDGLIDFPDDPGCDSAADRSEKGPTWACDDGIDNDADGLTDYRTDGLGDPGCPRAAAVRENPQCDDDQDNDGDGGVDWDGGIDGGAADPQCIGVPWSHREQQQQFGCGLSYELVLVVLGLGWLRRRRRRWQRIERSSHQSIGVA